MFNFTFHNPTRIHFGKGQIKRLSAEIPEHARVLAIFGGGSVKRNGVYKQVVQALCRHVWIEFSGVAPNPDYELLLKAVELAKAESVDFVLAVGGGSVVDGAKFVAAACCDEGDDPWALVTRPQTIARALPLGVVLTLPGTGSEYNIGSVISRGSEKIGFTSPLIQPQFSILDPATTFSLPRRQLFNGIVDAFVHVVEQYVTFDVDAKIQDRFAEGLLLTLIEEGTKAVEEKIPTYETRANIMWAASLALNGLIGSGVPKDWTTHMIGHEVTALYGYDHAQTLAMLLPTVWRVRKLRKWDKLLQYAQRVWGISEGSEEEIIDRAIGRTEDFFKLLGMSCHLDGVDMDKVVQQLERHGMISLGENRDIDLDISRNILRSAGGYA